MAGGRASGPVDETTFEGRLRAARLASPFDAQELAEAIGKASAQTIYDYEKPSVAGSPTPEALGILAKKTGTTLDWLVYGIAPNEPESQFVRDMRAVEDDLSPQRQRELAKMAKVMADEDRQKQGREAAIARLLADAQAGGLSEQEVDEILSAAIARARRA